nr:MAG TPA: hypothetical protein [Caudoviricetes sp.]
MNLINRDVLAEYISENEKAFVYAIKHKDMTMLEDVILDIPIAYDVDKVVEQLEDRKSLMLETFKISESDIDRGRIYGMDKAIEIVKGGGVDAKTDS